MKYIVVFSVQNEGQVKSISVNVANEQKPNNSGKLRKIKIFRMMEEIKIGKILILVSTFYIILTVPHTIDQFTWMVYQGINYTTISPKFK